MLLFTNNKKLTILLKFVYCALISKNNNVILINNFINVEIKFTIKVIAIIRNLFYLRFYYRKLLIYFS